MAWGVYVRFARLFTAAWLLSAVLSDCPFDCHSNGYCNSYGNCDCINGFQGADCSERVCPAGYAFSDMASATDTAHAQYTECSNRGICDRSTGLCTCMTGYEGVACQRLACPSSCNGHGTCVSMKEAGAQYDGRNLHKTYTYTGVWDADLIYGCLCDEQWTGYDCSVRKCPGGDNPLTTGEQYETVILYCLCDATCSGSFTLTYAGQTTPAIQHDAGPGTLETHLEALYGMGGLTVSVDSGAAVCSAAGATTTIAFNEEAGDLPMMEVASSIATTATNADINFKTVNTLSCECTVSCGGSLVLEVEGQRTAELAYSTTSAALDTALESLSSVTSGSVTVTFSGSTMCETSAQTSTITILDSKGNLAPVKVWSNGITGTVVTVTMTNNHGTNVGPECAGQGTCDRDTGVCSCFSGYKHSDGAGAEGLLPDCGYAYATATACPLSGTATCNDHGTCDGSFMCTCHQSWDGNGNCAERTCPKGFAWFDEAWAAGEAHQDGVECSNRGVCDRSTGACTCQSGFEGSACERMACGTSTTQCSGVGRCVSMSRLAQLTTSNGNAAAYTYGTTNGNMATWDAEMVYGCYCDDYDWEGVGGAKVYGWEGYDCSLRKCPVGDDPSTPSSASLAAYEVQTVTCTGTGGTFTLTFRQQTTATIAFNAYAAAVSTALEALSSIGDVKVTNGGDSICTAGGNAFLVTFISELGDVPDLTYDVGSLTAGSISVTSTTGNKELAECANKGQCDRSTGLCKCFKGYTSSDGDGNVGGRDDCGFADSNAPEKASKVTST